MFDWVDHTAELELRIEAATEADVFVEAARALRELLEDADPAGGEASSPPADGTPAGSGAPEPTSRAVDLEAPDRPRLLADWLDELVFLAETEGFVINEAEDVEASEHRLRAVVRGRLGAPRPLVKAVTYHRLTFEPADSGWRATVVFDV